MKKTVKRLTYNSLAAIFSLLCLFLASYLLLKFLPFPELDDFLENHYGMVIRDRNGIVLRVLPAKDGVKREWTPLSEIPPGTVRIFLAAEDKRFNFHPGVDVISMAGSFIRNLNAGRTVSGASTVTMQLARIVNPHSGGLKGKIGEARDALRIEAKLSKKRILELWFNNIPFGSNIEGLPAMARARFGRSIRELDDNRAALLSAVPRRPLLYDPAINPETAVRSAMLLSERNKLKLNEDDLLKAAMEAARPSSTGEDPRTPFLAPHFTERVAAFYDSFNTNAVPSNIQSTLDFSLQRYAEEELALELSLVSFNRVNNGAILAIENSSGAVRAYVGSASWFNDEVAGKIDGIHYRAQPGSCLKPFLYAMALDTGFSPADIMPDLPTVFGSREAYIPSNFNNRFNGPVRFRIALASSLNIPAVYLLERLGVRAFEEYLADLGFASILETMGTHGAGLALGNAEVSLEEMVCAFSAFPRGGAPAELTWTEDAASPVIEPVMSPYASWIISDILSDRSSRYIGFGPAPALATPFEAMFKTGTANQFQHIWALGATKRYTVGVWMGNFSGETVIGSTGSSIPARLASKILAAMEESDGNLSSRNVGDESLTGALPQGVEEVQVCALSGLFAGPHCAGLTAEWIKNDRIPPVCFWHTAAGLFLPPEYQAWHSERFRLGSIMQEGTGRIRTPVSGSVYYLDPSLPPEAQALRIETSGFNEGALVFVNEELHGSLNYAGVYAFPLSRGNHRVAVTDSGNSTSAGFSGTAIVDFTVR